MGLTHRADDLPSRFSRGLRQKTAILLALIRPFEVLIVDEPFVGLDPGGRDAFVELIDDASAAGATVVVATHQLEYVAQADRCVALRDGVLVYDGPPGQVDVHHEYESGTGSGGWPRAVGDGWRRARGAQAQAAGFSPPAVSWSRGVTFFHQ